MHVAVFFALMQTNADFDWLNRKVKAERFQVYSCLENAGIGPATSRMQSERSTIWANSPRSSKFHKGNVK